jgi:hypothetical protein
MMVGCAPQPDVEVTSGSIETPAFSSHVEYYDLDLPSDIEGLEWVQLRDWDTNEIYLRFFTNRAGLANLLTVHNLTLSVLNPSRPAASAALPKGSSWDTELPSKFLEWQPREWSTSRAIDQVDDTNTNGLHLSVDLLIDRPEASRAEVFIHVVQS